MTEYAGQGIESDLPPEFTNRVAVRIIKLAILYVMTHYASVSLPRIWPEALPGLKSKKRSARKKPGLD